MALILALFAWLISQAEKYYSLICCERKILFLHWKSTAHKTSEQCHYWFLWSVGIKPITQIPAPILFLLYPNTHGPKRTYFVSTFWKYRPFSETNFILLCWNLLSSRWAHRTRALHQLCFFDVTNERMHYTVNVLAPHACKCKVPELT